MSALEEKTAELSVVKRIEEEKHRRLEMEHSALTAKKEFIETNYDYTSNVTDMTLEVKIKFALILERSSRTSSPPIPMSTRQSTTWYRKSEESKKKSVRSWQAVTPSERCKASQT